MLKNKKLWALCAVSGLTFAALSGAASAQDKSELKDFSKIVVKSVASLDIEQGDEFEVDFDADLFKKHGFTVKVKGDTLIIDSEKDKDGDREIDFDKSIDIVMPKLEMIKVYGVLDADIEDFKLDTFKFKSKGVSNIDLEGSCEHLIVETKGVTNFDAKDLKCEQVSVKFEGVGKAKVYAKEAVSGAIDGLGKVSVYGQPKTRNIEEDNMLAKVEYE